MSNTTKLSKVPTRTVISDDLIIEVDGVEYRPHAGESITVDARLTIGDTIVASRFQSMDLSGTAADIEARLHEAAAFIASKILAWTWTDTQGNPYASPPSAADIEALDWTEAGWLLGVVMGQRRNEEDRGND